MDFTKAIIPLALMVSDSAFDLADRGLVVYCFKNMPRSEVLSLVPVSTRNWNSKNMDETYWYLAKCGARGVRHVDESNKNWSFVKY